MEKTREANIRELEIPSSSRDMLGGSVILLHTSNLAPCLQLGCHVYWDGCIAIAVCAIRTPIAARAPSAIALRAAIRKPTGGDTRGCRPYSCARSRKPGATTPARLVKRPTWAARCAEQSRRRYRACANTTRCCQRTLPRVAHPDQRAGARVRTYHGSY